MSILSKISWFYSPFLLVPGEINVKIEVIAPHKMHITKSGTIELHQNRNQSNHRAHTHAKLAKLIVKSKFRFILYHISNGIQIEVRKLRAMYNKKADYDRGIVVYINCRKCGFNPWCGFLVHLFLLPTFFFNGIQRWQVFMQQNRRNLPTVKIYSSFFSLSKKIKPKEEITFTWPQC